MVANWLIPDHDAGVFNPPWIPDKQLSLVDRLIMVILGGFGRWDGLYFLHIAEYGYTYENCVAFFPLYPFVVRFIANIMNLFIGTFVCYKLTILLSATLVSLYCFIRAADTLYDLSVSLLGNKKFAYRASLLFCINPASVFFSAPYSESMFAYITFKALCSLQQSNVTKSAFLFGLTSLTRSNGLVSIGFLVHHMLNKLWRHIRLFMKDKSELSSIPLILKSAKITVKLTAVTIFYIIIAIIPFSYWQFYAYRLFCKEASSNTTLPSHLVKYGRTIGYKLIGDSPSPWCEWKIPLSYSYIQNHHWNVGFLHYYEFKQLPNFVLASPMIAICLASILLYYKSNKYLFLTMGFGLQRMQNKVTGFKSALLLPFIFHLMFLTFFSIFFIHIQVTTRLIASASPVVYWFCAYLAPVHGDDQHSETIETGDRSKGTTLCGEPDYDDAYEYGDDHKTKHSSVSESSTLSPAPCDVHTCEAKITEKLPHSNKMSPISDECLNPPSAINDEITVVNDDIESDFSMKNASRTKIESTKRQCTNTSLGYGSGNVLCGHLMENWKHFRQCNTVTKLIYVYFISYLVIGTVAFSNFFPWT